MDLPDEFSFAATIALRLALACAKSFLNACALCAIAIRPSGVAIELLLGAVSQKELAGVRAWIPCSAWKGDIPVSESVLVFQMCAMIGVYSVQMKVLILRVCHLP